MKQQCKTLPTPRSNKKSGSFIANTLDKDFQYIQDNPIQSDQKQRQTRPYMMIQPKLIEEFDANNQKTLKVSFKNSITDLQTLEEPIVKQRENSGSVQGRPKQCKSNIPPRYINIIILLQEISQTTNSIMKYREPFNDLFESYQLVLNIQILFYLKNTNQMKHNVMLPNAHFRKHWTRFVKTWYNQPAAKRRRQLRRQQKALAASPRPVSLLRPVVRGQTNKYNAVQKLGRGFSLVELKEAKLNASFARSIGISVDHRRRNKSKEELELNTKRLQAYLQKLVLFPRTTGKPKNGVVKDSANDVVAQPVVQNENPEVITFQRTPRREKATVISKELRSVKVFRKLRQEWYNAKFVGVKEKRRNEAKDAKDGKKQVKK